MDGWMDEGMERGKEHKHPDSQIPPPPSLLRPWSVGKQEGAAGSIL